MLTPHRRLFALALVVAVGFSPGLLMAPPAAIADQVRERQYWLQDYGIERAWGITRGAGVRIAIIDTGVDGTHQDLQGAVVAGADFSGLGSSDGQTPVGFDRRHGTMVASLAAGRGNGIDNGVLGSAPEADIISASMSFGAGAVSPDDQIARAVRFAVDAGAGVISLSLTRNTRDWPESWDDAFTYAAENDVVVIAAAGNRGSGTVAVGAPATMPGVLTVGGVTQEGIASDAASSQGITIGVMAPSEGLVGAIPGGGYVSWSGTSGAAPIVAGIVALVRSAYPDMDANNVINRILATATPATATLPDPLYGFGLVNAYEAITRDVPSVSSSPLGSLEAWITLHRKQEGAAIVVPLGPSDVVLEEVTAPTRGALVPNTRREVLPYLVTGGFAVLMLLVLSVGAARVFLASRTR
jgi:subtilisin family serine protease